MTLAQVTPGNVLHLIQAGVRTRADLADRLNVLPSFKHLADVIEDLKTRGEVVEKHGHLHPHDLLENLED